MASSKKKPPCETGSLDETRPLDETHPLKSSFELFICAIDLGTSRTGFVFSTRNHPNAPLQLDNAPLKVPTAVLLNQNSEFDSFGTEAEERYAQLIDEEEHVGWRFFQKFKMILFNTGKTVTKRGIILHDAQGKPIKAIIVFAHALRYLKGKFLERLLQAYPTATIDDVKWVVTVPAIWDDSAKQFMREAAINAGIPFNKLVLALEPECASLYCQSKQMEIRGTQTQRSLSLFKPGFEYFILDLGGGTTDITVHKMNEDQTLEEIFKANGGPWGGEVVNVAYKKLLMEVFTEDIFREFESKNKDDLWQLDNDFERKKIMFKYKDTNTNVFVTVPQSLVALYQRNVGDTNNMSSGVTLRHNKIKISSVQFRKLFDEVLRSITLHLREILKEPRLQGVKTVFFAGGFSESELVRDTLKDVFPPGCSFIFTEGAGIATLQGALISGNSEQISSPRNMATLSKVGNGSIRSRVSRYTYGIETHIPFNPAIHPKSKKFEDDRECFCKDIFHKYFQMGSSIIPGKSERSVKFTVDKKAKEMEVVIYRTEKMDPKFTDDPELYSIGTVVIDMSEDVGVKDREIAVSLKFEDTELVVAVTKCANNERIWSTFDMLA